MFLTKESSVLGVGPLLQAPRIEGVSWRELRKGDHRERNPGDQVVQERIRADRRKRAVVHLRS